MNQAPNFLGIGAPKCATTWLSEVLRRHPEIFVAHGKEIVYFSSEVTYEKGEGWYLDHFRSVDSEKAVGEFSVSYMGRSKLAAQRIYDFNPDMKFIAILRDPVLRSFSHYRWLKQLGRSTPESFGEALAKDENIVRDSLYYSNLQPYWELFPEENFLLLRYEDVKTDGASVLKDVYRFLQVDENFSTHVAEKVLGKTIEPRSQLLEKFRIKAHTLARRKGWSFLITTFKKTGLSDFYRQANAKKASNALSRDDYVAAISYFENDVKQLSHHAHLNLDHWLNWNDDIL